MYSLLGLSIASATYDIHTKVPDITNAVVDATKDTRTMIKAKLS